MHGHPWLIAEGLVGTTPAGGVASGAALHRTRPVRRAVVALLAILPSLVPARTVLAGQGGRQSSTKLRLTPNTLTDGRWRCATPAPRYCSDPIAAGSKRAVVMGLKNASSCPATVWMVLASDEREIGPVAIPPHAQSSEPIVVLVHGARIAAAVARPCGGDEIWIELLTFDPAGGDAR